MYLSRIERITNNRRIFVLSGRGLCPLHAGKIHERFAAERCVTALRRFRVVFLLVAGFGVVGWGGSGWGVGEVTRSQ